MGFKFRRLKKKGLPPKCYDSCHKKNGTRRHVHPSFLTVILPPEFCPKRRSDLFDLSSLHKILMLRQYCDSSYGHSSSGTHLITWKNYRRQRKRRGGRVLTCLVYHSVGFNGVRLVVRQAIAQVVVVIQQSVQYFEQVLRAATSRRSKSRAEKRVSAQSSILSVAANTRHQGS